MGIMPGCPVESQLYDVTHYMVARDFQPATAYGS